jgi:hypothetical protein
MSIMIFHRKGGGGTYAKGHVMAKDDNANKSRRGPLLALAVTVILFIVGWLLAQELRKSGQLEDCILSGRTNCEPIQTQTR